MISSLPSLAPTYMDGLWFGANLITALTFLYLPFAIGGWFKGVRRGTGLRALSQLFQAILLMNAAQHLVVITLLGQYPILYYVVVVDTITAFVSVVSALALYNARFTINRALISMVKHTGEWVDKPTA